MLNQQEPKKKKSASEEDDEFVVRWQFPALQADLVVEKLRALNPNMSSIEIGERSIPGKLALICITNILEKAFIGTAAWEKSTRDAVDLPTFLETGSEYMMVVND